MIPVNIVLLGAIVVLAGVVTLKASDPLSLAGDLGVADEDACAAVAARGASGLNRLEAAGFPRPTDREVELYRLSREGAPQAVIRIDWAERTAECAPLDYTGRVTVDAEMTSRAYGALVGEMLYVMEHGDSSSHSLGNLIAIWIGTEIVVEGSEDRGDDYLWDLAKFSAGWLAR